MAILDAFEVSIIVDGEQAQEYDDEEVEEEFKAKYPTSVSKYVEAASGAFFAFRVCIKKDYLAAQENAIVARIDVDGKISTNPVISIKKRQPGHGSEANSKQGEIETGDDTNALKNKYNDLGTFRIELWRTIMFGRTGHLSKMASSVNAVPEKALKGRLLDLTTRYIPDFEAKLHRGRENNKLDSVPFAVFRYKYRTHGALRSLLIIPRSPTPLPLEDRPIEELSRDEMAEVIRQQREKLQIREEGRIKQEDRNGLVVKRERQIHPEKGTPCKFSKGPRGEKVYHLDSD